ncbi:hypothetical protein D9757_002799 [Collybiopsis confluens]|uniref:Uncharacterized protein n=1 Tax=Collybiopsis confluens TaxID=2823264 RepID=A0A8H5MDU8_9AGAR|nr:hypothetical protein D9757_002799 [Collybiopsis confluens]
MSSLRPLQHRRRSQSASNSFPSIHRQSSWRSATKRAHPAATDFSSLIRDVESWRSKRRRRDGSLSGTSSDDETTSNSRNGVKSSPTKPAFASTSVDFGLSARKDPRHRHSMHNSTSAVEYIGHNEYSELARIRSDAFWELKRSVAENGEGLVRRMRDYEQSRARSDTYSKVKDAQKRGRKRQSLLAASRKMSPPTRQDDSESEDDEDVQILSGHLSESFLSQNTRSTSSRSPRPSSPGCMDEDSMPREGSSTCMSEHSSDPLSLYSAPFGHSAVQPADTNPLLSHSTLSADTSSDALTHFPLNSNLSAQASRSNKALAALSLAMANGAGSIIEDYEALRALQPILTMEGSEVEDIWH